MIGNFIPLSTSPLFKNISADDLPSMLGCLGAYCKAYRKDEFILHSGDAVDWIGIVQSGCIQMIKEDYWGDGSIFAQMRRGELFGETFACAPATRCPVSFKAAEDSQICVLPFHKVLHICSLKCVFHHKLIENMVALLARKNARLMDKIEVVSKKSIRDRLLAYLLQLSKEQRSDKVVVPLNRTELAEYLCADRSALSREIRRLAQQNLLRAEKNTFMLQIKAP